MGLSEDLVRLVEEGKRCKKILLPYATTQVTGLNRELLGLYRAIEKGFQAAPEPTKRLANSQSQESTQQSQQYAVESVHMQHVGHFLALQRVKRALLIYHSLRATTISQHIWKTGQLPAAEDVIEFKKPGPLPLALRMNSGSNNVSVSNKALSGSKRKSSEEEDSESTIFKSRRVLNKPERSAIDSASISGPNRVQNGSDRAGPLSPAEQAFALGYQALMQKVAFKFPLIDLMGPIQPPKEVLVEIRVIKDCGIIMSEYGPIKLVKGTQMFVRSSSVQQLVIKGDVILV